MITGTVGYLIGSWIVKQRGAITTAGDVTQA
jgi:hypothetical protein